MLYFNDPEEFKNYLFELIEEIESGEFDNYDNITANFDQVPNMYGGPGRFYHPGPPPMYKPPAAYNVGTGFTMWQATKPVKETINKIVQAYAAGKEYCGWVSELGCYVFDPTLEGVLIEKSDLPNTLKRNMIEINVLQASLDNERIVEAMLLHNGLTHGTGDVLGTITIYRDTNKDDRDEPLIKRLSNGFTVSSSKKDIKELKVTKDKVRSFLRMERRVIYASEIKLLNAFEIYTHEENYGRIMGTLIGIHYDTMFDDYRTLLNCVKGGVPISFIRSWIPGETLWSIFAIMGGGNPIRRYGPMYVAKSDI